MSAPETGSGPALRNLVAELIEELADEMPDDARLEIVRADLLAAGRSYENAKKKDLALRFYLAMRSLLREHESLHERLRRAESSKREEATEFNSAETGAAKGGYSQQNGFTTLTENEDGEGCRAETGRSDTALPPMSKRILF